MREILGSLVGGVWELQGTIAKRSQIGRGTAPRKMPRSALAAGSKLKRTVVRKSLLSVIFTVSLVFLVQGYLLSTSALLTYNETFASSFTFEEEQEYDAFSLKFVAIFLMGEAVGALLYIPFGNFLSRRTYMGLFAVSTIVMLAWTALAGSIQSLLMSRFL